MWRAVFHHEFLGSDLRNFQAVDGTLTVSPSVTAPVAEPPLEVLRLRAPEALRFELAEPWTEVIGLSGRVRIRVPFQNVPDPFPVLQLGGTAQLRLHLQPNPAPGQLGSSARVLLQVGSGEVDLATVVIPRKTFVDVRVDWHSSGQAHLYVDGRLAGYHNALSPGAELQMFDVVVGNATPIRRSRLPMVDVAKVFVRALRRVDPLVVLSGMVGDLTLPDHPDGERCVRQRTHELLALTDRVRAFMAQTHLQLSQPWQESAGPIPGPFSDQALEAHRLALAALTELARILRSRDFSHAEAFLDPFGDLLEILHGARPAQFRQLLVDHLQSDRSRDPCADVGAAIYSQHRDVLELFFGLLGQADARLKTIAGVA